MYRQARQYDLAIAQFKKNLEMDPAYAPSTNNISLTYQLTGQ